MAFEQASEHLQVLTEVSISADHIQTLAVRVGGEMLADVMDDVDKWEDVPNGIAPGSVATISMDGGRAQCRKEHQGVGVHENHWRETKVACLQVFETSVSAEDPHPLLPTSFRHQETILKLVHGLKGHSHQSQAPPEGSLISNEKTTKIRQGPVKRWAIATLDTASNFGGLVLRKALREHLDLAERKAFLGDGDPKNWTIHQTYFKEWTPILDFVHAIEYAFEAAQASTENRLDQWNTYLDWATHLWQGRTLMVIRRCDKAIATLQKQEGNHNARIATIQKTRNYFCNNIARMKYPEYRQQGFPVSSCHVESLIKQFNHRVKSTEKFWNETSLKAILCLNASLISNDQSWENFWDNRYQLTISKKRKYHKQKPSA